MNAEAPLIHIVDDDASFRNGVARLLKACGYRVALYQSGAELLEILPSSRGCIVLDMQMPGLSGPQLQGQLADKGSPLPIVFLTGHGNLPASVKAIKAGAEDFLAKPVAKEDLLGAVERALTQYDARRERGDRLRAMRAVVDRLSQREREVFDLVVRGKLNKQIAYELGISERTVKAHRHSIMEKLQVRSLAEAVSIAERLAILAASMERKEA